MGCSRGIKPFPRDGSSVFSALVMHMAGNQLVGENATKLVAIKRCKFTFEFNDKHYANMFCWNGTFNQLLKLYSKLYYL